MKRVSLILLAFAIGCGGEGSKPPAAESPAQPAASTTPAATTGKPSEDEAVASIRDYFTDPASGIAFQNVQVEQVSAPIEAPTEAAAGEAWIYSVSMKCENILGDKLHNKNWVILVGRQDGKVKVKEHYHSLERIAGSPLGKAWWAKSGLPEPTTAD